MCLSWYTPKPNSCNTGVSGLAVLSSTTLICTHCREGGLGTTHIQAIQMSLPKSVGTYYHVSCCTSDQKSPQKASTGMTCLLHSSRGDNHILGNQKGTLKHRGDGREQQRGKLPVSIGPQGGQAGLLSTSSTLLLQLPVMPGEWTEPRAALAPLYTWQDLKETEQSQGNRGICRKNMFVAFVSADSSKHL